jgi:hypothetical protein
VGYVPGYRLEAAVLARQIAKTRPAARIAVLYSDDADGRELLGWFRRFARVAAASTDVAALRASGADTLVVLSSSPLALPLRDWVVYANAAAAEPSPGAVSTVFVRMPGDPAWPGDPTSPRLRPSNAGQALGLAAAYSVVAALRRAGPSPSRAAVLTALRRSVEADKPVPGAGHRRPWRHPPGRAAALEFRALARVHAPARALVRSPRVGCCRGDAGSEAGRARRPRLRGADAGHAARVARLDDRLDRPADDRRQLSAESSSCRGS